LRNAACTEDTKIYTETCSDKGGGGGKKGLKKLGVMGGGFFRGDLKKKGAKIF